MNLIRSAGVVPVLEWMMSGTAAQAHELSSRECAEASDFIQNAALARDEGMAEAVFRQQFHADGASFR